MTSIASGDSKDNPVIISDKLPIKDKNDWWIKHLKLQESDRVLLLNGSDLNDNLINAAHSLLSSQFSEIEGFQNTILAHHLKFQPVSNSTLSIQILHAGISDLYFKYNTCINTMQVITFACVTTFVFH